MARLFGTDGVRGIANTELSGELAYQLGRAGAFVLTKEKRHTPKILVGLDTRISGDMLEAALTAGICSVGAHAVLVGVIPTPGVAYLLRNYNLDAGVMISASHNPVEYNGIKFFDGNGYKLRDEWEDEIEQIVTGGKGELPTPTGVKIGTHSQKETALQDYVDFLVKSIPTDLKGVKIALDCANGSAYRAAPLAFARLGAQVYVIHNEPDGTNINHDCGSTHIEALQRYVKEVEADIGLAFDGDADRCLAVDEKGNLIDGDKILSICGTAMKKRGELRKDTIVGTVMSNLGLHVMGEKQGITIEQTDVGDRYVLERMKEKQYNLGGEQSGHIIFSDYNTTGDGILTGIQLLRSMKERGGKASDAASLMEVLPQVLVNAIVKNENKHQYMEVEEIKSHIDHLTQQFAGEGRVLIRPSGTEPLVRVMIEGRDQAKMQKEAEALAALITDKLS